MSRLLFRICYVGDNVTLLDDIAHTGSHRGARMKKLGPMPRIDTLWRSLFCSVSCCNGGGMDVDHQ
jgi:hypothetical protein